jgi:hypothetical protein
VDSALSRIPNWIRWVLTPISSPAVFALVGIAAGLVARLWVFLQGDRPGWSQNFFDYLVVPAIAGYFAVYAAAAIAPKARPAVALILGCLWVALGGFGAFFALVSTEYALLLPCLAVAGAAIAATVAAEDLATEVSTELDVPKVPE